MDTQVLIDKLATAISFQFKADKTAPGLTVSKLKHGYYCSVVRYDNAFAKGKVIFCKAEASSLGEALVAVAKEFLTKSNAQLNPLQELDVVVHGV